MDEQPKRQDILKAVLHYFYQDNTLSGSHCRFNLKYHLVWIPKYRRPILVNKLAARLSQILLEIANDYEFKIIAHEVMPDHVHVLVEAPTKYSPAQIAGYFKGISSKLLRRDFPDSIKSRIWKEGTLWARGYYIATLADNVTTEVVKEYINNQKLEKKEPQQFNPADNGTVTPDDLHW
jgi:putative transposase